MLLNFKQNVLISLLCIPLITSAKTLIVCEGTEKIWMSFFGDSKEAKIIVETWSIENDKLNGLVDCPISSGNRIWCSLNVPNGSIPGIVKLFVTYELDRVSGFFTKRLEQISTIESEIKDNPFLRNIAGSQTTFTRITTTEGYCKKGVNKF
jgi:hypothetical protein